jgi:hypothetical protein
MALAVTWFRKKDWPRWLELDPEFQPDYDYWLKRMKGQIEALEKAGILVERVVVDPDKFVAWCNFQGCDPASTSARAAFASMRGKHGSRPASSRPCVANRMSRHEECNSPMHHKSRSART